jgi:hypothetical protein
VFAGMVNPMTHFNLKGFAWVKPDQTQIGLVLAYLQTKLYSFLL